LALGPPEKPVTKAATAITATSATLHGELNPGLATGEVGYFFGYNTEEVCAGSLKAPELPGVVEGNHRAVAVPVTGLSPSTKYTFCLIATSPSGSTEGSPKTFTTLGVKPAVEVERASHVSSTDAVLEGLLNPENQESSYRFEYATNPSMTGAKVVGEASIAGIGQQPVGPADIGGGLEPNTTYYYRLTATSATGTTEGPVMKFMTLPNPPTAITGEASSITPNSATISGSVTPGSVGPNSDTKYLFQYGLTASYGAQIPLMPGDVGQGTSPVMETANLGALEPGTTYHYRILATNDLINEEGKPQTVLGEDQTFMTEPTPPILSGVSVSAITQSSATVTATLNPNGLPTRYELLLGSTPGALQAQMFGHTTGAGVLPLTLNVESLSPGTLYYYELIAINLNGTAESPPEGAFTTAAALGPSNALTQPSTPLQLATPAIVFPRGSSTGVLGTSSKRLTNAQKLAAALKACRKKPNRHRAACERQARGRYRTGKSKAKRTVR
jgi:hypothetical protein